MTEIEKIHKVIAWLEDQPAYRQGWKYEEETSKDNTDEINGSFYVSYGYVDFYKNTTSEGWKSVIYIHSPASYDEPGDVTESDLVTEDGLTPEDCVFKSYCLVIADSMKNCYANWGEAEYYKSELEKETNDK